MEKNAIHCFVCSREINCEVYRCADVTVCSVKCSNNRLMFIKNIDPYLTNPYFWDNSMNYENKFENMYEEQYEIKIIKHSDVYEYDYEKNIYCLSLNRRKCFDKFCVYLYMFVGIVRQFVY